jgi:hypothetical protein
MKREFRGQHEMQRQAARQERKQRNKICRSTPSKVKSRRTTINTKHAKQPGRQQHHANQARQEGERIKDAEKKLA